MQLLPSMTITKSFVIVFLCIGVVLQMLGAPVSFWDLDGSDDDFISSLLMGACVLSGGPHISAFHSFLSSAPIVAPQYSLLQEKLLFHPPNVPVMA